MEKKVDGEKKTLSFRQRFQSFSSTHSRCSRALIFAVDMSSDKVELACTYAILVLKDGGQDITVRLSPLPNFLIHLSRL